MSRTQRHAAKNHIADVSNMVAVDETGASSTECGCVRQDQFALVRKMVGTTPYRASPRNGQGARA